MTSFKSSIYPRYTLPALLRPQLSSLSQPDMCLQVEEDVPMLDTIAAATAACTKVQLHAAKQGQACLVSDPKGYLCSQIQDFIA